jgi:hypothetical protein
MIPLIAYLIGRQYLDASNADSNKRTVQQLKRQILPTHKFAGERDPCDRRNLGTRMIVEGVSHSIKYGPRATLRWINPYGRHPLKHQARVLIGAAAAVDCIRAIDFVNVVNRRPDPVEVAKL